MTSFEQGAVVDSNRGFFLLFPFSLIPLRSKPFSFNL
jgi:hypothetical protein